MGGPTFDVQLRQPRRGGTELRLQLVGALLGRGLARRGCGQPAPQVLASERRTRERSGGQLYTSCSTNCPR